MVHRDERPRGGDVDAAGRHQHRPVRQGADSPERALLPAGLVVVPTAVREHDEVVARAAKGARGTLEQLRVERLDVRGDHADHVRAAAAQALGDEARRIAELLDHLPHAGRRLLGDPVAVVDHLGHRGDRDAGCGGDVRDRDGAVGHGAAILQDSENDIDIG